MGIDVKVTHSNARYFSAQGLTAGRAVGLDFQGLPSYAGGANAIPPLGIIEDTESGAIAMQNQEVEVTFDASVVTSVALGRSVACVVFPNAAPSILLSLPQGSLFPLTAFSNVAFSAMDALAICGLVVGTTTKPRTYRVLVQIASKSTPIGTSPIEGSLAVDLVGGVPKTIFGPVTGIAPTIGWEGACCYRMLTASETSPNLTLVHPAGSWTQTLAAKTPTVIPVSGIYNFTQGITITSDIDVTVRFDYASNPGYAGSFTAASLSTSFIPLLPTMTPQNSALGVAPMPDGLYPVAIYNGDDIDHNITVAQISGPTSIVVDTRTINPNEYLVLYSIFTWPGSSFGPDTSNAKAPYLALQLDEAISTIAPIVLRFSDYFIDGQ